MVGERNNVFIRQRFVQPQQRFITEKLLRFRTTVNDGFCLVSGAMGSLSPIYSVAQHGCPANLLPSLFVEVQPEWWLGLHQL